MYLFYIKITKRNTYIWKENFISWPDLFLVSGWCGQVFLYGFNYTGQVGLVINAPLCRFCESISGSL